MTWTIARDLQTETENPLIEKKCDLWDKPIMD